MSEETKNLLTLIFLGGFAVAAFFIWRKRTGKMGGATVGDIYIHGGTPTGDPLTIVNPDGSADSSDGGGIAYPLFDSVASQFIG